MAHTDEFFVHVHDTARRLFVSREREQAGLALSPQDMTPDDVDYEMSSGKDREILEICGMDQQSFEHFVRHYGKTYRYLYFFKCPLIRDFSPLEDLNALEGVKVYWNTRADRLWDFSKNDALKAINVLDARRLTLNPSLLKTSKVMEKVYFAGDLSSRYSMESLECFAGMPALRSLELRYIKLKDKRLDALEKMPELERFDFDAGMFTTEEIAWMAAKYPKIEGYSLCAYNKEDALLNDVRVCGYRKPGLDLPQQQKRLERYVQEFEALVEKYRNEK